MNKRTFIKTSAALGAAAMVSPNIGMAKQLLNDDETLTLADRQGKYILPKLPYAYNALEPYIDEQTMRLHHDIHHAGYVKGLNKATEQVDKAVKEGNFDTIAWWENQLAFNGAGHLLHSIYWECMTPNPKPISGKIKSYIDKSFGSYDKFKAYMTAATNSVQASGWGVLAYQKATDKLVILQAEKHQDLSQWMSCPILVIDVWEHAYYLKYQNKRAEYTDNIFNIINWDWVNKRLESLASK